MSEPPSELALAVACMGSEAEIEATTACPVCGAQAAEACSSNDYGNRGVHKARAAAWIHAMAADRSGDSLEGGA